jgi:hypothetical protein
VGLSRVFDVDGLWDALSEPPPPAPADVPMRRAEEEVPDSEDEGSSPEESPRRQDAVPPPPPRSPDIVLVTHANALLGGIFADRERANAHTMLQLLASRVRRFARRGALVVLLNSVSVSGPKPPPLGDREDRKRVDSALRSVFDTGAIGNAFGYNTGIGTGGGAKKPAFGNVFAQFLDLHVMATRVPRGRRDAEEMVVGGEGAEVVTVVEVLLDEEGTWVDDGDGRGAEEI